MHEKENPENSYKDLYKSQLSAIEDKTMNWERENEQ